MTAALVCQLNPRCCPWSLGVLKIQEPWNMIQILVPKTIPMLMDIKIIISRLVPDYTVHLSHICYQFICILCLAQFHIKRDCFSLVFPTFVQFSTQIVVLFLNSLFSSQIFQLAQKSWPTCSEEAFISFFQVTNNIATSAIYKSFNLCITKSQFSNNCQTIELLFNRSTW